MNAVKSNFALTQAINIGIPLVIIAFAAVALGAGVDSWTAVAMAAVAGFVRGPVSFVLLERKIGRYHREGRMGSYYNGLAVVSTVAAIVAVVVVPWLMAHSA